MALLYLSPALKDGPSFGPTDLGDSLSFLTSSGPSASPPHNVVNGDIIDEGVAWNTLDWRLVHDGQLPLWNDLSGNGLPLLLNFQSAPLALPTLVGYLFPLSLSFLVTVAVKLVIVGTGTYALTRLLGGRPLAAALAGTTFMLSGSLAGWLGWSVSGPLVWAGWIATAVVLVYRARTGRRLAAVALLSVCVAFCIYGGFPETYVLLAGGLAVLLLVTGAVTLIVRRPVDPLGLVRLGAGVAGGLALSSPLWLPGLAVIRRSVINGHGEAAGLPLNSMFLLLTQGYDGLPITSLRAPSGTYFGPGDYFETAAYIGIVARVFAVVVLVRQWRRPVVVGLGAMALVTILLVYDIGNGAPLQHLVRAVGLGNIAVTRMLPVLGLAVAVLAGLGLELVLVLWRERATHVALIASVVVVGAVVAVMWVKSGVPGAIAGTALSPLSATSVRRSALLWPTGEVLALLVLALVLPLVTRLSRPRGTGAGAGRKMVTLGCAWFVGVQGAFLVVAGTGINSYAPVTYPVTPAVKTLQHLVGHHLLGLDAGTDSCVAAPKGQACGVRSWAGVGFYPEINVAYGVAELAVYDPLAPKAYFDSWPVADSGQNASGPNLFVPSIDSVALARRYGVQYVLIQPVRPVPTGMHLVTTIRDPSGEPLELVRVPGATQFSFVAAQGRSTANGGGRVISVSHPADTTYRLHVEVARAQRLTIRITNVPGWHATADGHPLGLSRSSGDLLSALVPGGTTEVVLTYQPHLLDVGWTAALVTLVLFLVASVWLTGASLVRGQGRHRRRRRPREGVQPPR
jgi:hypothetical protein